MVNVVDMDSISKNVYTVYSSLFYKCVVALSVIVAICSIVYDLIHKFCDYNSSIADVWAILIGIIYFLANKDRLKYIKMWAVLLLQIMLALYILKY